MRHRLGLATKTQISVCKSPFPSAGTAVSLVRAKITVRSNNNKRLLLKLTTDRHEGSRGLSATAGLLVIYFFRSCVEQRTAEEDGTEPSNSHQICVALTCEI